MLYLKSLRVRDCVWICIRIRASAQTTPDSARPTQIVTATPVFSVLASIILCGAKYLGKHPDEDDTERGHACADDSDVDFDVRPVDHIGLVPRRVV
jgi:hypothetical protein